jgi:hypothetical protein
MLVDLEVKSLQRGVHDDVRNAYPELFVGVSRRGHWAGSSQRETHHAVRPGDHLNPVTGFEVVEQEKACYAVTTSCRVVGVSPIEGFYNRQRWHSALGYLTPEEHERR